MPNREIYDRFSSISCSPTHINKLYQELAASKAEVERLRSQFNRAVDIAEMFQRGNSGLHYQCQCRSCQMLAELKGEATKQKL